MLLKQLGWPNVRIADELEVTEGTIRSDVNVDISTIELTENILRDALDSMPAESSAGPGRERRPDARDR